MIVRGSKNCGTQKCTFRHHMPIRKAADDPLMDVDGNHQIFSKLSASKFAVVVYIIDRAGVLSALFSRVNLGKWREERSPQQKRTELLLESQHPNGQSTGLIFARKRPSKPFRAGAIHQPQTRKRRPPVCIQRMNVGKGNSSQNVTHRVAADNQQARIFPPSRNKWNPSALIGSLAANFFYPSHPRPLLFFANDCWEADLVGRRGNCIVFPTTLDVRACLSTDSLCRMSSFVP